MENLFVLNPKSTNLNIQDAIYSKIQKSKAILTCAMFAAEFIRDGMELDNHTFYHVLWAIDDCLEEIDLLFEQLKK